MRMSCRTAVVLASSLMCGTVAKGAISVQPEGSSYGTNMRGGFNALGPASLGSWSYEDAGPVTMFAYDAVTNSPVSWLADESYSLSGSLSVEGGVLRAATSASFGRTLTQTPPNYYFGDVTDQSIAIMEFRLHFTETTQLSYQFTSTSDPYTQTRARLILNGTRIPLLGDSFVLQPGTYLFLVESICTRNLMFTPTYGTFATSGMLTIQVPTPGLAALVVPGAMLCGRRSRRRAGG